MLKQTATIKSKLVLLLLLAVGGSMLLAGIAISFFFIYQYDNNTHSDFSDFYKLVKYRLEETDRNITTTAKSISQQESIISSVSFISEYVDLENYQPLVFDGEKQDIANRLSRYSRSAQINHVRVYDKNGWLVSFADTEAGHEDQGYLSFINGKPVLFIKPLNNHEKWQQLEGDYVDAAIAVRKPEYENNLHYIQDKNGIALEVIQPIIRTYPDKTQKQVGTLLVSYYLKHDFLDKLAKNPNYHHALIADNKIVVGNNNSDITAIDFSKAPDLFGQDISEKDSEFDIGQYHVHAYSVMLRSGDKFNIVSYMSKKVVAREIKGTLSVGFLVFLFSSLLILFAGLNFARKTIAEPVEKLIEIARQIKFGNYTFELSCSKNDEFGILCDTLRKMAKTIKEREDDLLAIHEQLEERVIERTSELQHINRQLSNEIQERELVEQQLIHAKEQAEKSNRAKSIFLSKMSHELRTPLNAILGFSQLLEHDPVEPLTVTQKDSVSEIIMAGNHLLDLINEILDLARIEAGRMVINLEPVNLTGIIKECVQLVSNNANEQGIRIHTNIDNDDIVVNADVLRLKQVILNLLSNAIKYNKENGEVIIKTGIEKPDQGRVNITDTGIGISEKHMENLFTPFERFDQDNDNKQGTGIGLVISRDLVQLMGGEMTVESKEEKGSTFSFTLPLAK